MKMFLKKLVNIYDCNFRLDKNDENVYFDKSWWNLIHFGYKNKCHFVFLTHFNGIVWKFTELYIHRYFHIKIVKFFIWPNDSFGKSWVSLVPKSWNGEWVGLRKSRQIKPFFLPNEGLGHLCKEKKITYLEINSVSCVHLEARR